MNKFKKLISSVAAASIAASMFASVSFASIPSDAVGTDIETQATVLGALEIMVGDADTGTFRPNDPIIRSEVAKVGVALMGLSQVADSSSDVSFYPDVDKSHWANGFINVATAQKLVIGDDTGTFRPDDQIKYGEAVTILVRALGYEPQALAKGGFPTGYIATANSIGLTKNVSGSADKLIARGDVAKLAYNALNINLMEQTGFGTNISYEVTDKTLLEDKLGTQLVTGRVEAVGTSVLGTGTALLKNEIKIDGNVYNTGNADVRNVLGFTVDAYVTKNARNKRQTLAAVVPAEGKNNTITVNADSIAKIDNTSSGMALHYYADADLRTKTIKATLSSDAQIIYNGKSASKDKFDVIDSGSIVLLDSNGDSRYDTAFVNETVNYVVDKVYPASDKIVDKYNMGTLELDLEDETKTIVIEKGGKNATLKDLKEWDVLTITKSEDNELIYAIAVHNTIEGKITEKDSLNVYIGDKKYRVAANYTDTLSLGTEGTFYLDFEGKIAAFDGKSVKSSNYAYLDQMAISTGMDKVLNLKLFTRDGELLTLSTGDKVRVNSDTALTAQQAFDKIGSAKKLVTYETNAKGVVTRINTYKESLAVNEDEFVLNVDEDNVVYRASSSKLISSDMSISVGANTLIFDIPENGSSDDYAVRDKNIFADGGLYDVKVFDITEDYRAGVIIVTNSDAKADEESAIAVVDKITTAKNDSGETIHKVYVLSEGKEMTLVSEDNKTFEKTNGSLVSQGDIIQYRKNASGEVDAVTVLFNISEKDTEFKNKISDNLTTVYGKITKIFSDSINVQVSGGKTENYDFEDARIYVYDSTRSKTKVSVGDSSDLSLYDNNSSRVFVKIFKDEVQEIVVVK